MAFRLKAEEGFCEPVGPRRERVAMLGATPTNRHAPLEDSSWEVWGINRLLQPHYDSAGRFRADRWFELHPMTVQNKQDLEWISACPAPLYTLEHELGLPLSLRYPIERVETLGRELFSCTMCYQVALAVVEGFREIGLFGMDLNLGSARERTLERACLLWWLGFAEGRGITVTIPWKSDLLLHPLRYGYDYHAEVKWCEAYLEIVAVQMAPWKAGGID